MMILKTGGISTDGSTCWCMMVFFYNTKKHQLNNKKYWCVRFCCALPVNPLHTMYYKGGGTLVDPLLLMHMKQQQQGTLWNLHPLLLFHLGILSIPVHQTVWKNNNKERKCPSRTLFFYWITCKEVGYYAQQTTHSVWWCTLWYYTHTRTRAYTTAATISTDLIRSI